MEDTKGPNEIIEGTQAESASPQTPSEGNQTEKPEPLDSRRVILWGLGGAYLCYVGFQLCSGFLKGDAESNIGFFLGGIVFFAIGGFLLVMVLKDYRKAEKEKADRIKNGEALPQDLPLGGLLRPKESSAGTRPRKMSISERANLASVSEEPSDEQPESSPSTDEADKAEQE